MRNIIFLLIFLVLFAAPTFAQSEIESLPNLSGTVQTAADYKVSGIHITVDNNDYLKSVIEVQIAVGREPGGTDAVSGFALYETFETRTLLTMTVGEIHDVLDAAVIATLITNNQRNNAKLAIKNHIIAVRDLSKSLRNILVNSGYTGLNFPTRPVTKVVP